MEVPVYNPGAQEAEAGGFWVWVYLEPHGETLSLKSKGLGSTTQIWIANSKKTPGKAGELWGKREISLLTISHPGRCKYEDLNSDHQHSHKKSVMAMWACNPSLWERRTQERPWRWMASQSSPNKWAPDSVRDPASSQTNKQTNTLEIADINLRPPYALICIHTFSKTHKQKHKRIDRIGHGGSCL